MLWAADQRRQLGNLLDGLHRRGAQVCIVRDAPAVIVELANRPTLALIIDQPEGQPQQGDLLTAVRRYFPNTVCRGFTTSGRLVALPDSPHTKQRDAEPSPQTAVHDPVVNRREPQTSPTTAPLVTEEELAMLIGEGPIGAPTRGSEQTIDLSQSL